MSELSYSGQELDTVRSKVFENELRAKLSRKELDTYEYGILALELMKLLQIKSHRELARYLGVNHSTLFDKIVVARKVKNKETYDQLVKTHGSSSAVIKELRKKDITPEKILPIDTYLLNTAHGLRNYVNTLESSPRTIEYAKRVVNEANRIILRIERVQRHEVKNANKNTQEEIK